ncbi:putative toxin-antitoxin system toxin component, PIN family [Agrobacterium sp. OT33]|uniref:PIN domain-containing protein n=1 Tax=Agrobacterium sp. OT33 TaxID=2815338 RepID=UPI001A8C173B|nr:PIN domain-containing protein [Agrobacterium sp. OT33]MBO0126883.1 PIN domain-containing protein [Agrobacterium sp. OT33]
MIVVDANVVLSALRSSRGASHILLRELLAGNVEFAVSPAVALEYEDVLKRPGTLGIAPSISGDDIDTVLDAMFSQAHLVAPGSGSGHFCEIRRTTFTLSAPLQPARN